MLSNESSILWGLNPDTNETNTIETEFNIGKNKMKVKPLSRKIIYDGVLNFESISKYAFTIDLIKKEVWIN